METFDIITTGIVSALTGVITWFLSRKKYNTEVQHNEILNMDDSLDFYKALSESNQKILNELLEKSEELVSTNIKLLTEVQNLKIQVGVLLNVIHTELGDIDLSKYGINIEDRIKS